MDKIYLANWSDTFANTEEKLVFSSERYTDFQFQFNEPGLASGLVKSVGMPGMQLTEFFIAAGQPIRLVENSTREGAESVFVLDGVTESHFENLSSTLQCNKNQHNFQYNKQFSGEHIISSPEFHALAINYDLDFLKQLLQNDDNDTIGQLANCVYGQKPYLAGFRSLQWHVRIAEVVASMQQNSFTGIMRYLFLESKMMELFALQMHQVQTIAGRKDDHRWSVSDNEKLHAVRNYIESNYLDDFSLKDLTYKFNLNEFKLKKGYKQLFQTTVFGHVLLLRMQKAKTMLEENAMNVSEAGFFIGYENVSSFCAEFKKRFGYSPGRINALSPVA
ncbi:MAG TPA: AraC family transcriptional regulator [Chryseolinea sp.]|nr:AraC family transcriptional regulator [Chryseolinea sp.]